MTGLLIDPYDQVEASHQLPARVYVYWGRNPAISPSGDTLGHLDAITGFTAATIFEQHPEFYNPATFSYADPNAFLVYSLGPDRMHQVLNPSYPSPICSYDPSNGLLSGGDIIRWR
jgi:hypothetical protein